MRSECRNGKTTYPCPHRFEGEGEKVKEIETPFAKKREPK